MTEPHRCCQTTVNDLEAAHKRVAAVELQLLLLKAHNDNLAEALAAQGEELHRERWGTGEAISKLREELAAVNRDRNTWRKAHANAAKQQAALSTQVDDLTKRLADMTVARDNLVRAQTAATIQQMQEDAA